MTALQEMFANIEDDKGLYEAWEWIMANKERLLEKEKHQIVDACEIGMVHGFKAHIDPSYRGKGEKYFNQTYGKPFKRNNRI